MSDEEDAEFFSDVLASGMYDSEISPRYSGDSEDSGDSLSFDTVSLDHVTLPADDISSKSTGLSSTVEKQFGSIKVSVIKDEIANVKVDVLVNSTSPKLKLDQGVASKALLNKAGNSIQQECNNKYPNGISNGEIAQTGGGNLHAGTIFHVSLPKWDGNSERSKMFLTNLVVECLKEASGAGLTSIAFPALGTGSLGYPKDVVAKVMFGGVESFQKAQPTTPLTDVRFVIYPKDQGSYRAFSSQCGGAVASASTSSGPDTSVTVGQIQIDLNIGNLPEQKCDIVMLTSTKSLDLQNGTLSKAVAAAAGPNLQMECTTKYPNGINHGQIALVGGANLPCKWVYLGALPRHDKPGPSDNPIQVLNKLVTACLTQASQDKMTSICFPTLGTGYLKYPAAAAAKTMLTAIKDFSDNNSNSSVKKVVIVIHKDDASIDKNRQPFKQACAAYPRKVDTIEKRPSRFMDLFRPSERKKSSNERVKSASSVDIKSDIVSIKSDIVFKDEDFEEDSSFVRKQQVRKCFSAAESKRAAQFLLPERIVNPFMLSCDTDDSASAEESALDGYVPLEERLYRDFSVKNEAEDQVGGSKAQEKFVKAKQPEVKIAFRNKREAVLSKQPGKKGAPIPQPKSYLRGQHLGMPLPPQLSKLVPSKPRPVPRKRPPVLPRRQTPEYCRHMSSQDVSPPSYWTTFTSNKTVQAWNSEKSGNELLKLVNVDQITFQMIEKLVQGTWEEKKLFHGRDAGGLKDLSYRALKVVNIQRIENIQLYQKYSQMKKNLFQVAGTDGMFKHLSEKSGKKHGPLTSAHLPTDMKASLDLELNEGFYFHGTKTQNVQGLQESGLDPQFANEGAVFGKAIYMAESSTKADQYADERKGPRRKTDLKMFLVRSCLGNICLMTKDKKMKKPSCTETECQSDTCSHSNRHHSIVEEERYIFREFVVYDGALVYPEYIITYERV